MIARFWTGLAAALLCCGTAAAQEREPTTLEIKQVERLFLDDIVASPPGARHAVELYVRAETRYGEPVEDLRKADVIVRDNGDLIEQEDLELTLLSETGYGASCVLAIDASRTMKGEPFDSAKAAALNFLDRLDSFSKVAVLSFSDQVEVVTSFNAARAEARVQLESLTVDEESLSTVLYDASHKAIDLLRSDTSLPRRSFVILFSDGKDSGSSHTLEEIIELGRGDELTPRVPIFSIGYARFGGEGLETLKSISQGTAADSFHAKSTILFGSLFNDIWRQMLHSYVIRYPGDMDGARHTVEVTSGDQVDVRTGSYPYIGGEAWPWLAGGGVVLIAGAAIFYARRGRSAGRLVFTSGPRAGEAIPLRGTKIRIGALPDNDVEIPSSRTVSRYHAQIHVYGRKVEIEDLGARNRTYVNGTAVRTSPLEPGDKLRFGDVDAVYER